MNNEIKFLNPFQSIAAIFRARKFLPKLGEEFTDRFGGVVGYYLGQNRRVFVTDPEIAQQILRLDHKTAVKPGLYSELSPYQGNGPVISGGEKWLQQRRWSAPFFLKSNYPSYQKIMDEEIKTQMAIWDTKVNSHFNIVPELNRLTFRILSRCVLGSILDKYLDILYKEINNSVYLLPKRFLSPLRTPITFPLPTNIKILKSSKIYRDTISAIIDDCKSHESSGLLGHLVSQKDISKVDIIDMVATMVAAGFETTANLLTWTFALLAQNSDTQNELRTELNSNVNNENCRFMDAIICEALRLYPPILIPSRKITTNIEVAGYKFAAGTEFDFGLWSIQRHKDYWPNSDQFEPNRFLSENFTDKQQMAFMPFAVGPRECSGKAFSLLESKSIISQFIKRYSISLAPGYKVEPEATIILRPKGGLHVTLTKL